MSINVNEGCSNMFFKLLCDIIVNSNDMILDLSIHGIGSNFNKTDIDRFQDCCKAYELNHIITKLYTANKKG